MFESKKTKERIDQLEREVAEMKRGQFISAHPKPPEGAKISVKEALYKLAAHVGAEFVLLRGAPDAVTLKPLDPPIEMFPCQPVKKKRK